MFIFWILNSGLSIEFNEIHNLIRKDVALQESEKNRRKLLMILKQMLQRKKTKDEFCINMMTAMIKTQNNYYHWKLKDIYVKKKEQMKPYNLWKNN